MKTLLFIIIALAFCSPALSDTLQLHQADNQYFSILLFPSWSLEYAGGKENQEMYSIISSKDRRYLTAIFYDYKGLNPNEYLSNKCLYSYSANGLNYYRHDNYTDVVKGKDNKFVSIRLNDSLEREMIIQLISIFTSIEIK